MSKPKPRRVPPPRRSTMEVVEIKTYPAAIRFLNQRTDIERMRSVSLGTRDFRLERMEQLLDRLGNPHQSVQVVHVAGTVGKGSTVAMIAAMLRSCGYVVGEFTSPHLTDVRERVQLHGEPLSRPAFTEHMQIVGEAAGGLDFEPTFFELITALAFNYFAEQAVDLAVIETGLGGRLDCTNVVTPLVSVLTRIDYDHMHLLGKTLPEIAAEKAGIFKPGVPAISVAQDPEVDGALRAVALERGTPLSMVGTEIDFSCRFGGATHGGTGTQVCVSTPTSRFEHIEVPIPGEHQASNCATALAVVDVLRSSNGYALPDARVYDGLAQTRIEGRMEQVWDDPRILVDGAHNPLALKALVRSIGTYTPSDSMVIIFGCCEDKDVAGMLDCVAIGGDKVIFTRARGVPRASDPEDLQRMFTERSGRMSQVADTIGDALDLAGRAVGRDDLICVTGSFYLVGETKKHLAEVRRKAAV